MSKRRTTADHSDGRRLGEKAIACLRMASMPCTSAEYRAAYDAACERWSEKAVLAKFQELVDRGYMECGVSARTGWLEERGRAALAVAIQSEVL